MTERLKEIKANAEDISYMAYGDGGRDSFKVEKVELAKHDYDWLIQQAELADLLVTDKSRVQLEKRVEELEKFNEAISETSILNAEESVKLWEQNQRFKQALEEIKNNSKHDWDIYDAVAIAIRALEREG